MPELEFPGHVRALLAAYPEFGNHPETHHEPATTFGVFDEVLNLEDRTMAMVFDLYEELLDVFPSRYVHIGGDECPTAEWLASPLAAELAAAAGTGRARRAAALVHRAAAGLARGARTASPSAGTRSPRTARCPERSPWRGAAPTTAFARPSAEWTS